MCFQLFSQFWIFIFTSMIFVHFLTIHFHCVLQRFQRISSYIDNHFWIPPDSFYGKNRKHNVLLSFPDLLQNASGFFCAEPHFPNGFILFSAFCGSHLQELIILTSIFTRFCSRRPPGRPRNLGNRGGGVIPAPAGRPAQAGSAEKSWKQRRGVY